MQKTNVEVFPRTPSGPLRRSLLSGWVPLGRCLDWGEGCLGARTCPTEARQITIHYPQYKMLGGTEIRTPRHVNNPPLSTI